MLRIYREYNVSKIIFNPFLLYLIYKFERKISNDGVTNDVIKMIPKIIFFGKTVGKLCLAKVLYLKGNFRFAIKILVDLLKENSNHVESYYLLNKCYIYIGKKEEAFQVLRKVLDISKRKRRGFI